MRGISDNERQILTHISRWGSDGYPVRKLSAHRWTWGPFFNVQGPPTVFKTKRDAVANFEAYIDILRDAIAGRI